MLFILKNCYIWLCLHYIICKYTPVSSKLGQNIYVQQNLNEFDHGSNWSGKTGVICSWIGKNCCIGLLTLLHPKNINQSAPNLVTMYMSIRSQMSLIMGQVIPDQLVFSVLEVEKLNLSSLFGIYLHCLPVLPSTQVSDIWPSLSSCCQFGPVCNFCLLKHQKNKDCPE